jgi:tetratricopeptide (TPR) repeat protein
MPPRTPLTELEASTLRSLHRAATQETYYDLLDIAPNASAAEIEAAYHALARTWHPDRFYSRDMTGLEGLLEEVFVTATRASRTLADVGRRAAYDQEIATAGKVPRRARVATPPPVRGVPVPPPAPSGNVAARARSSLYQQVAGQVAERVGRAQGLVAQAKADMAAAQWPKAESALKLALTWDANHAEAKALLVEVSRHANTARAKTWLAQAESEEGIGRAREALVLYKRVIETDLPDASLLVHIGKLIVSLEQDDRAAIAAFRSAVAKSPTHVDAQLQLGEAYVRVGLMGPARRCAEAVLAIDGRHVAAKALLARAR